MKSTPGDYPFGEIRLEKTEKDNEFTVADIGTDEDPLSVEWVKIGTPDIGGTEDITFSDISPLLMSGTHQVNVT